MSLLMVILNHMLMFVMNPMPPRMLKCFPITVITSSKRKPLCTYNFPNQEGPLFLDIINYSMFALHLVCLVSYFY